MVIDPTRLGVRACSSVVPDPVVRACDLPGGVLACVVFVQTHRVESDWVHGVNAGVNAER